MVMKQYFYFSKDLKNFIFEDLNFNGTAGIVGVFVVCMVCTFMLEGIKSLLYYLNLRMNQTSIHTMTDTRTNKNRMKFFAGGSFLRTIDVLLGYLLMLAVMTYDTYILVAVIVGSVVGYFLFGAVKASNMQKFREERIKRSGFDNPLASSTTITASELQFCPT